MKLYTKLIPILCLSILVACSPVSTHKPVITVTMLPLETPLPTATPTSTPLATPTDTPSPTPAPMDCGNNQHDLELEVCWNSQVKQPGSIAITIEMADPEANYSDWVLGDVLEKISSGRLNRGESTTVEIDVNWSNYPYLDLVRLFYVYGKGDDGSTFAQVMEVHLSVPSPLVPTPTASCGYAHFVVTTASDLEIEYPNSTFSIGIANEGILSCGDLDWSLVEPSLQIGVLSCAPVHGVLEGSLSWQSPITEEIQCAVDWNGITPGQTRDYFLVLFSYPRHNGTDTAHLIKVRIARP